MNEEIMELLEEMREELRGELSEIRASLGVLHTRLTKIENGLKPKSSPADVQHLAAVEARVN